MDKSIIGRLQQTPMFGGLSAAAIDVVLANAQPVAMAAGECFMREGELGDTMFLLESGCVRVIKRTAGGERCLRELNSGDFFGEMALLDINPRSATVRAHSDCRALAIPGAALLDLYHHDVAQFSLLSLNLGREVSRRLREVERLLEQVEARAGEDAV
ncbi:MAG: cyclic nucleotide-binding domain-containing protein [Rhodocyclaceae bacterium]|nr:cyclic nucleotide-binding domain-containing protein [Rhodocyclaceae bacterium]MBX3667321.1 cyclic nucleotide-binding domain-containing protein [Rhodocyclaceae bacterium]